MPGTQTQQLTEAGRQSFKAITRIALNNWHYIDHKILTLNKSINFFTGHSGSGKSTVIDAMQIVLYANTDGRGFFNKAAADDSDRSLLEYLRGMINIGENNQAEYKRNHNFSTTIVLELEQTGSGEKECVALFSMWKRQPMKSAGFFSGIGEACWKTATGRRSGLWPSGN